MVYGIILLLIFVVDKLSSYLCIRAKTLVVQG